MRTKQIIEQDICATCVNVCLLEPPPLTGPWEKKALCSAGWPYTRVFASANAIDECPQYERVMQPTRPWILPLMPSTPQPKAQQPIERSGDGSPLREGARPDEKEQQ